MTKPACPIYSAVCPEHGFVHGAEAEELRAGIERLIKEADMDPDDGVRRTVASELQSLLDSVDARDSLAFLEADR